MTDDERGAISAIVDEGQKIHAKIDRAKGDQDVVAALAALTATAQLPSGGGGARCRSRSRPASARWAAVRRVGCL